MKMQEAIRGNDPFFVIKNTGQESQKGGGVELKKSLTGVANHSLGYK